MTYAKLTQLITELNSLATPLRDTETLRQFIKQVLLAMRDGAESEDEEQSSSSSDPDEEFHARVDYEYDKWRGE